jgi:hypothetical protein
LHQIENLLLAGGELGAFVHRYSCCARLPNGSAGLTAVLSSDCIFIQK